MTRQWPAWLVGAAGALAVAIAANDRAAGQRVEPWGDVLDQHPAIQYATRPTTDRVATLNQALASHQRSLRRDGISGYLVAVLDALGVPAESQVLVFSRTGVQREHVSPRNPRALYFDQSVVVGYIPRAPVLELAAHDPQQGVIFYTLDQSSAEPAFKRQMMCRSCHVSATTEFVPGMIARSNAVGDNGDPMPQIATNTVTHETPHPDRWGGWFVTFENGAPPYSQRAHMGNITFAPGGTTSNSVFVDWMASAPEKRGYLSASSDIVSLLVFDHQMHAINLLTRLNWESRVAAATGAAGPAPGLINQLAEYLLFVDEARPQVPLTARAGYAEHLAQGVPKDSRGRSLAQMDLTNRLMRYPCSYMVYAPAFDALPGAIRQAVYSRMIEILSGKGWRAASARMSADDRQAVLEILRDTKTDFPR